MKKILLIIFVLTCFEKSYGQDVIEGKIRAENDNQAVVGAIVKVCGTDVFTYTDEEGSFRLRNANFGDEIEISRIGFQTLRLTVPTQTVPLEIWLKRDITTIEEVVVSTGYETLRRERATGSFDVLSNETLIKQTGTDILSRLEAVASGLSIDRSMSRAGRINVRGINTFRPDMMGVLIVVDNFPYDGDIENINPNDIESVTILKDAAAASIWGARASNGVIIITTKKSSFDQPMTIEFNANLRMANKPDLSKVPLMSSDDFIDVEKMLFENNYFNSQINSSNRPALSPVVELLLKRQNATPTEIAEIDAAINSFRTIDVRDEFSRHLYQPSFEQQYSLLLRNGNSKHNWTASAGLDNNVDNLANDFKRINIRLHHSYKPIDALVMTGGFYYTHRADKSGRPGYGEIGRFGQYIYPYARFADDGKNHLPLDIDVRTNWADTVGKGGLLDWRYYPLDDYKQSVRETNVDDLVFNFNVNYRLIEDLNLDFKYLFEKQSTSANTLHSERSYYARNEINRFSQIDPLGNLERVIPYGGIVDKSHAVMHANNFRTQLNFDKDWSYHQLSILAGSELRSAKTTGDRHRLFGYNDRTLTFEHVDQSKQHPVLNAFAPQFVSDNTGLVNRTTNFVSFYLNSSYTFKRRFSLSLSGRRDASNLFGLKTNQQWNPFWSIGFSWNIADESFLKNNSAFSRLRFRATHGHTGNISPSMVAVTTIGYVGTNPFTHTPIATFTNYYDSELKWEQTAQTNFALDFGFANNKITGNIDIYLKKGNDLFGPALLDYTGGIGTTTIKNVANMKGWGLDFALETNNISNDQFSWSSMFNFSATNDKVVDYHRSNFRGSNFVNSTGSAVITGVVGKPIYSVLSYRWAGLDPETGEPRGYLNGEVSGNYAQLTGVGTHLDDLVYHGPRIATSFGSFNNTFSFKNIQLDFALVYKFGHYFRRESINYNQLFANWTGHSDFAVRWQQPGDELITNVPALVYPSAANKNNFYAGSEVNVERADHIRLQFVNLSYRMDKSRVKSLPFDNLSIYLNASNLGVIWRANQHGIDPDYNYEPNRPLPSAVYALGIRGRF